MRIEITGRDRVTMDGGYFYAHPRLVTAIKDLQAEVERAFKAGYAINILDAQTSDPDLLFEAWKAKAEGEVSSNPLQLAEDEGEK